jgi:hypothetical protein
MAASRLTRIGGLFAVGLAALIAGTAQASATSCSTGNWSFSTSPGSVTITDIAPGDDISGVTSVTINGANSGIINNNSTTLSVSIQNEPAPNITAVSSGLFTSGGPDHLVGSTAGGGTMTITGSNFRPTMTIAVTGGACDGKSASFVYVNDVVEVDIGGTKANSAVVNSDTSISVTTPPGIAGLADVTVITTNKNSGGSGANRFAYVKDSPSVTGVGPNLGLTTVATSVNISGTNFISGNFHDGTPATTVNFPCPNNSGTPTTTGTVSQGANIAVTSPTCTQAGAVNITVTTVNGSVTGQYQFVAPGTPTVTNVSPGTGTTQGNTSVTITGSNFIGATKVTFGTVDQTAFQVNSAGSITTSTPPQNAAGTVAVSVTINNGTTLVTSTQNGTFQYKAPAPIVSSISPPSGSTAGGDTVHIFGAYFTGATSVTIGGANATSFTVVSDGQIDLVTAAHAAGTGLAVTVTTGSGSGTGMAPDGVFTYGTPAPTVTAVSPNSGSIGGNQSVTITGTNFTGATSVTFGGAAATGITVNSDTQITATTPAHAAGIVDVAVTTAAGTGIGSNLYSYASSPPTVTGLSPATGSTLGGTSITITGTNFNGTPQVTVGGVAASQVTVVNSTTITAVTPAGSGAVPVLVTTSFGTSVANPPGSTYTYAAPVVPPPPAPVVSQVCSGPGGAVCPGSGTKLGQTPVTITGTNFTGATAVTFGGKPATAVVVVNATTITALTPANNPGTVDVTVTTPGGTSAPLPNAYTYLTVAPTVTAVNPNTGSTTGNSAVTITGTDFTGATAVTFDGIAVGSFTVLSATTIVTTTPAHPAAGAVNVVVTTPSGSGTGTGVFTYVTQAPPTVTAVNPNSGNTAGGTQVQITGTNFSGASSVTIGGNPATFVTVVSQTQINATTPASAVAGPANVVVTTPAGTSGATGNGKFTYIAGAPTVTGVAPNNGPTAGGTAVTITGTNFTGATSVTIGGIAPTGVTIVNATTITATTAAHAAGAVDIAVTTPVGTGNGKNLYTYKAPIVAGGLPVVTSVAPNTGVPGGGTTVTITGGNFTNATAVSFGGVNSTLFTVVSSTSITARSPGGTGTVHVTVTTALGSSATTAADQFSYVKAKTSMDVTSSPNPSTVGQAVTFTARITGSNPTGQVTFTDNGKVIGTATLVSGVASLTIATLTAGSHSVTGSYPGDINNQDDPETVIQVVNAISDSVRLRQMQMAVMPIVTNMSGQAISGAIDNAISAGFGGACQLVSPNGGGFTYCIDGGGMPTQQNNSLAMSENHMLPEQRQMLEEDFKALGYAAEDPAAARKPAGMPEPRNWLIWFDARGTDFTRNTIGSDLKGTMLNGTAGVTRRITADFLVGVVGGYEHFNFTSQAYNGVLKGDGYTAGGYVGWRLAPTLRFDASGAWSAISANNVAGTASGNFTGYRWFASGGVTGTYAWDATVFEPSARVYGLWERENAYTDSLGTLQAAHNFSTGRGSAGLKVSQLFPAGFVTLAPYVGLYGDYYFSKDDSTITITTTPGVTSVPLLSGAAARATGGVTMMFGGGAQLSVGGEYSGLASDTRIWNLKLNGSVPF